MGAVFNCLGVIVELVAGVQMDSVASRRYAHCRAKSFTPLRHINAVSIWRLPAHAGTSVALGTRVEERQPDTVFGLIPAAADRLLSDITARVNFGIVPDLYIATTESQADALAFISRVARPLADAHRGNADIFGNSGERYWFIARHPIEAAWFADALLREAGEIAHEAFGVGVYDFVHNVWGRPEAGFDVWLTGGQAVVRYHRTLPSVSFLAEPLRPRPIVEHLSREPVMLVRGFVVPVAQVSPHDIGACADSTGLSSGVDDEEF